MPRCSWVDNAGLTPLLDACLLTPAELSLDEELWPSPVDPFRRPCREKAWQNGHARSLRAGVIEREGSHFNGWRDDKEVC